MHPGAAVTMRYTLARLRDDIVMDSAPVAFTRVKPGESLLAHAAE